MARNIGIDLHRNNFVAATRAENGRTYLRTGDLKDWGKFAESLRPEDRLAVEMTTNTRLFHDAVRPAVAEVQVVNTAPFKLITKSTKKTDKNDARTLALYLEKDMLPTVRLKEVEQGQRAARVSTRDTLVKQRTSLKNKINNRFAMYGRPIQREMGLRRKRNAGTLFGLSCGRVAAGDTPRGEARRRPRGRRPFRPSPFASGKLFSARPPGVPAVGAGFASFPGAPSP